MRPMSRVHSINISLLLLLVVVAACFLRHNDAFDSHGCHRFYPQSGEWLPDPPYWIPTNCPMQRFGVAETINCMTNRTFYVMGNSVPRQYAFSLLSMLGAEQVKREGQKELCPKHETFWGASCHQELAGVRIRFLHMNWIDGFDYSHRGGFPYANRSHSRQSGVQAVNGLVTIKERESLPNKPSQVPGAPNFWEAGNCIDRHMRSCLRDFFAGHSPSDVLVFVAGTAYSEVTTAIDMDSWLLNSAANFGRYITAEFHGHVFRVTSAPFKQYLAPRNPTQLRQEALLWNLWAPGSEVESEAWYTIDQHAINAGRLDMYNDHIHFVGPLSEATVYQILNALCPGRGSSEAIRPSEQKLRNHVLVTSETHIGIDEENNNSKMYYYVDGDGYLHDMQPDAVSCVGLLEKQLGAAISLPLSTVRAIALREPLPRLCDEGQLLRYHRSRAVWLIENGERREFQNGQAMLSRGYQFGQELVLAKESYLEMIPVGAPIYT